MKTQTWARISVGAGSVVASLAALSLVLRPPAPCGGLARGYAPLIAFELARTEADLHAIFGATPSACRAQMIDALDRANQADLALFIPAYCAFLVAWFFSQREEWPSLARSGAGLSAFAAVADVLENVCMMSLTPAIDARSPWLARLPVATAAKWLALALVAFIASAIFARSRAWLRALMSLAAVITVAGIASPATFGAKVTAGIAFSWLACLFTAAQQSRGARQLATK